MRRIWTSTHRAVIDHCSQELDRHEIAHSVDAEKDLDWGSETYGTIFFSIWSHDDADVERAKAILSQVPGTTETEQIVIPNASINSPLKQYLQQKFHMSFDRKHPQAARSRYVTICLLLLCCLLFALDTNERTVDLSPPYSALLAPSPLQANLLFDYPRAAMLEDKLVEAYGLESLDLSSALNAEGTLLREQFLKTPYWGGLYAESVMRLSKKDVIPTPSLSFSLFGEKIREGEIWRIVTPSLLHINILHLVFNLMWIISLGSQIERKISPFRYLILIAIIAAVSNTAQYLMTGPHFEGISGVICGMIGFMAARQRISPWESYQFSHLLYSSLLFFIWAFAVIGGISFFLESYLYVHFPISFANTAHITGLATGMILGRMKWFQMTRYAPCHQS